MTAPARLNVDHTSVTLDPLHRSTAAIVARFPRLRHLRPISRRRARLCDRDAVQPVHDPGRAADNAKGNDTLQMNRLRGYPEARHQQLLVLFVRARKPGDQLLVGGISPRRLVSTAVDLAR